ncbi:hypothetical protein APHAL10511_008218 [Amanita phalloides]|nr:hypothetical protein APHAL10511_008218 [Amanita phalloides]
MMAPAVVQGRSVLLTRSVITQAVCSSQYSWMSNSDGQSPCLVAAQLSGACATGNWDVPALPSGLHYTPPNSTTANYCTCSWAVYNLLGACTACQGVDNINEWSPYIADCGNNVTNTYFPVDKVIPPNNTLLPYWASTNPMTWSNGRFNVAQAQSIQSKDDSNINLSNPSANHKSKSLAGPIIGGVIGGIGAIIVAIFFFFFIRRKQRGKKYKVRKLLDPPLDAGPNGHGRSLSDLLSRKGTIPMTIADNGYLTSPGSNGQTNFDRSVPYDLSLIGGMPQNTPSPPPLPSRTSLQPGETSAAEGPENVIVPFTLTSIAAPTDRKRPDGGIYPIYEEPTAVPSHQTAASRRRLNPPTYTESVDFRNGESSLLGTPTPSVDRKGRARGPQNSIDSTNSTTTNTNTFRNSTTSTSDSLRTQMPPGRASGLDDVMTQFGFRTASVVANGSAVISNPTGARRATVLSSDGSVLSPDDIA